MNTIDILMRSYAFNRQRTFGLLDQIEQLGNAQAVLGWRPGAGRAHLAWQMLHIAVTEEIFATERLAPDKTAAFADLLPRFRGGSTPDDDIPALSDIRRVLTESRDHLLDTLGRYGDNDLGVVPEAFKQRNLTVLDVLHIIGWHESHHHGQAHITLNLYKAQH